MNTILDKVLFIGPTLNGGGGMASVIKSYKDNFPAFHYMQTNSHHGTIAGALRLLWLMIRLPFYRLFTRCRILHIHGAMGKSFVRKAWVITWGKALGFKIIYHCHGGSAKEYFERRGVDTIRHTLDKCDHIIVLSDYWRDYFTNELGYPNCSVVNNIVSHAKQNSAVRNDNSLHLLFLGVITHEKGIFDLIDVIASHRDALDGKFRLTIGGAGESERLKKQIGDNRLDSMVKYEGFISGKQKEMLLESCDILILPSYIEGLPISILEAMAHSKAVIATTVGGIPNIIKSGYNGILTSPGDKDELFSAINHYLTHRDDVTSHGARNAESVAPYYPEKVLEQLELLYNSLL